MTRQDGQLIIVIPPLDREMTLQCVGIRIDIQNPSRPTGSGIVLPVVRRVSVTEFADLLLDHAMKTGDSARYTRAIRLLFYQLVYVGKSLPRRRFSKHKVNEFAEQLSLSPNIGQDTYLCKDMDPIDKKIWDFGERPDLSESFDEILHLKKLDLPPAPNPPPPDQEEKILEIFLEVYQHVVEKFAPSARKERPSKTWKLARQTFQQAIKRKKLSWEQCLSLAHRYYVIDYINLFQELSLYVFNGLSSTLTTEEQALYQWFHLGRNRQNEVITNSPIYFVPLKHDALPSLHPDFVEEWLKKVMGIPGSISETDLARYLRGYTNFALDYQHTAREEERCRKRSIQAAPYGDNFLDNFRSRNMENAQDADLEPQDSNTEGDWGMATEQDTDLGCMSPEEIDSYLRDKEIDEKIRHSEYRVLCSLLAHGNATAEVVKELEIDDSFVRRVRRSLKTKLNDIEYRKILTVLYRPGR